MSRHHEAGVYSSESECSLKKSSKLRAELWGAPAFRIVEENEDTVRDIVKEWPASSGTQSRCGSANFRGKMRFKKEGMVGCVKCC